MINAPITLPKSRIQSESGLITISSTFIGVTIATGFAKDFKCLPSPFSRIPAISTTRMLVSAIAAVSCILWWAA